MYYTLHARLKKTEPDYIQTDPVQHDSDQTNSGQTNPASSASTLNNPICIENVLTLSPAQWEKQKVSLRFPPYAGLENTIIRSCKAEIYPAISPEVCVSLTGNGCWKHHFVLRFISMNPALYLYRRIPCLTASLRQ